ncbi:MAG: DinB family protein [Chitinispirillaceae bacterium]|nr:DinB family protein [Chitinispirillaceae bacterium]
MTDPVHIGRDTLRILKRQFEPALQMIEQVITACPDDLWSDNPHGRPIWKRLLHALESVDFFLNDFGAYHFRETGKKVSPEFNAADKECLSKDEMIVYFGKVRAKCSAAFEALDDSRLPDRSVAHPEYTNLDIFILQIRHLALNIGRCHEALAANGIESPGWIGYGE